MLVCRRDTASTVLVPWCNLGLDAFGVLLPQPHLSSPNLVRVVTATLQVSGTMVKMG
jgi:hypothetical protein